VLLVVQHIPQSTSMPPRLCLLGGFRASPTPRKFSGKLSHALWVKEHQKLCHLCDSSAWRLKCGWEVRTAVDSSGVKNTVRQIDQERRDREIHYAYRHSVHTTAEVLKGRWEETVQGRSRS